jgi:hypothetical protein
MQVYGERRCSSSRFQSHLYIELRGKPHASATVLSVQASWNVMAHAQKPDFVFRRNGRVHWNRRGRQSIRLLAAEVCASAVVMLDTPCYEVVWSVLATHYIRHFPLHFPTLASPCAITFQLESIHWVGDECRARRGVDILNCFIFWEILS